MISKSFLFSLFVCLLVPAGQATAKAWSDEACNPPRWFKPAATRPAGDNLLGVGKGADVVQARQDARRRLGEQLVAKYGLAMLAWPNVRAQVNDKAYARDETLKALSLAVAVDLYGLKRLQEEAVCGVRYVALGGSEAALVKVLRQNAALGQQMNEALLGKVDGLESKRQGDEEAAQAPQFVAPEATMVHLHQLAASLDASRFPEAQLRLALLAQEARIQAGIKAAKAKEWPDQKAQAAAQVDDAAVASETYAEAVRSLHQQNYVAAFSIFLGIARSGDDTAQLVLGYMLAQALGVKRSDQEAVTWLKRAAQQNNGPAKVFLGMMLFSGRGGGKPDVAGALQWIGSAVDAGWLCTTTINECHRAASATDLNKP